MFGLRLSRYRTLIILAESSVRRYPCSEPLAPLTCNVIGFNLSCIDHFAASLSIPRRLSSYTSPSWRDLLRGEAGPGWPGNYPIFLHEAYRSISNKLSRSSVLQFPSTSSHSLYICRQVRSNDSHIWSDSYSPPVRIVYRVNCHRLYLFEWNHSGWRGEKIIVDLVSYLSWEYLEKVCGIG